MSLEGAVSMSAQEASARTGLSTETLRYYEREQLLPAVARSAGGHRRYSNEDLQRLSFLIRLRDTGMPIAVMRQFAALRLLGEPGRPGRLRLLLQHRASVRRRTEALQSNLRAIDLKIHRHQRILREQGALEMIQPDVQPDQQPWSLRALHHVQLAMPRGQEDKARSFFRDALGMTELQKPPVLAARGGCWFRSPGLELHLGVEEPFAPARKAHPGLLVDNLPGLAATLEAAGHPVSWDDNFPGYHRFYATDPFGNRLEFIEPDNSSAATVTPAS